MQNKIQSCSAHTDYSQAFYNNYALTLQTPQTQNFIILHTKAAHSVFFPYFLLLHIDIREHDRHPKEKKII